VAGNFVDSSPYSSEAFGARVSNKDLVLKTQGMNTALDIGRVGKYLSHCLKLPKILLRGFKRHFILLFGDI
jgi:hypothetical protein